MSASGATCARKVRVVNMSWRGDVSGVEAQLELCGTGKTPEERSANGRRHLMHPKKAVERAKAR